MAPRTVFKTSELGNMLVSNIIASAVRSFFAAVATIFSAVSDGLAWGECYVTPFWKTADHT